MDEENQAAIERLKGTFERSEHIRVLRECYDNVVYQKWRQQQLILISGESGTGKTVLASSLQRVVEEQGGLFLQGKFDQYQQSSQDAIATAFCKTSRLLERKDSLQIDGEDAFYLVKMIPRLSELFGKDAVTNRNVENMADMTVVKARSRQAFLRFVAAVSKQFGPVVLFLDDLQWAVKGDYEMIRDLLRSDVIQGLVVVGASRLVDHDHELSLFIRSLSQQIDIQDIVVSNLALSDIEAYLSSVVFPNADCGSLALVVLNHTGGNFFFMKEWLVNMLQGGRISLTDDVWQFDSQGFALEDVERSTGEKDNIVQFVIYKLRRLPRDTQELIKAASCLGVEFSSKSLNYVVSPEVESSGYSVDKLLAFCCQQGILIPKKTSSDESLWGFAHDRIQQAAYELIPETEKAVFHLSIGRALQKKMTETELEAKVLLVTSHLTMTTELISLQQERNDVAALCLRSGQRLVAMSNFEDAGSFIDKGLVLLGDDRWRKSYDLCLQIHNAAAELSYVRADFDQLELLSKEVFTNARTFEDTLEAHTTHVYALGTQHKLDEAVREGLIVLKELGEPLRRFSVPAMLIEHARTKYRLSKLTDRGFLNLPLMTDRKKLAAMRLLNLLYSYLFWSGDPRALLLTYKSVQMSIKHGITGMSAWSGRVYTIYNSFVSPWRDSPKAFVRRLESSQKTSFETGDIEYALLAQGLEISYRFWTGQALENCYQRSVALHKHLVRYKQQVVAFLMTPVLQATANLIGRTDSRLILTGEFMDEAEAIDEAKRQSNFLVIRMIYIFKAILACNDNKFDSALTLLKYSEKLKTPNMAASLLYMELYYRALARLVVKSPDIRSAKSNIRKLRGYSKTAPNVLVHWISHLEAELAFLGGRTGEAIEKFEISIAHSQRMGLIHNQAMACERAAICMARSGNASQSEAYLEEALLLYRQWGCPWKVEQLHARKPS